MAQVPATSYESTSLGDVAEFTIPFPFLSRAEVFVTVDGASVPFTWINDGLVQLSTVPELGAVVRRYRSTAAYVPLHQFSTGVPFLPRYVDRDFKQTLYAVQESVNDTAGTAAQALATAEESLLLVQDAFDILAERTQYIVLGAYGPGLNFQTTSQVFSYDTGSGAEFYAPGPSIALPYTTTGVGAAEIANFRSVGDAILRTDLDSTAAGKGADLVAGAARVIYASEWGCVAGADISTPLTAAAAAADARGVPLVMDMPNAILGTPFITPQRFDGQGCVFTGDVIVRQRKDAEIGHFRCTNLFVQGMQRSNVHNVTSSNDIVIEGYDPNWGVFYSDLKYLVADRQFRIDVSKQAVNANAFSECGGHGVGVYGLLITDAGAVSSLGIIEAHGNSFFNCDFSHSSGAFNDVAVRNQANHLYNCYFELGAKVVGNWTSIGTTTDGQSPPLVSQFNHVIASTDVNVATAGDSLSATPTNLCVGGDWTTRKSNGVPPGFSSSYATTATPVAPTPWGYTGAFGGLPVGANHTLSVNFVSNTGKFSALVWLYAPTGQAPFVIEVIGGAAVSYRTPSDVHYAGNGFFLYRISGDVVAGAAAAIRFTVSDAGGVARTIYLGAAFVSASKAALFPSYAEPIAAETSHAAGAEIKRGVRAQGYATGSPHVDIVVTYGEVFRAGLVGVPVWSVKPAAGYEGKMSKTELISSTNAGFTVRLYYSIDWVGEIHWQAMSR